jgi:nucleoside-diphosphate-sugar epimerase
LQAEGKQIRFASRSGQPNPLLPDSALVMKVDASDREQVCKATAGATAIYNCLNVPYQKWVEKLPQFQSNLLAAAEKTGARLVSLENLYGYGVVKGPITEELPLKATTKKGKLRADMARELLEAQSAGTAEIAIGRASDFYGPGVTDSFLGERVFAPLVKGKSAQVIGDPDQPHSYAYIEDVGAGLATLGTHPEAAGQAWHLPHAPAMSTRDMLEIAFELTGREADINSMGRLTLTLGGLFIPVARESVELYYEFDQPFVVDDDKFINAFKAQPTAIPTGIQRTVRWYQDEFDNH